MTKSISPQPATPPVRSAPPLDEVRRLMARFRRATPRPAVTRRGAQRASSPKAPAA